MTHHFLGVHPPVMTFNIPSELSARFTLLSRLPWPESTLLRRFRSRGRGSLATATARKGLEFTLGFLVL